jgi:hypothetical protein
VSDQTVTFKVKTVDDEIVFCLTSGPCEGVEFSLSNIHMKDDEDDVLVLDYHIVSDHSDLQGAPEFEEQLGQVMHKILEEAVTLAAESGIRAEGAETDDNS